MYFLFTDETNTTPNYTNGVKFFVYGGLIIPASQIGFLDEEVARIRIGAGYLRTDSLKFDIRTRPPGVSSDTFNKIKNDVVDLAIQNGCKILLYVIHHEIAKSQGVTKTIKWGADHIISKFHDFLLSENMNGFVIVDRLSGAAEYSLLAEKFTKGLLYQDRAVQLNHIKLFASSCDNGSHLSSLADIAIGCFRYCINNPKNFEAAKMEKMLRLMWSVREEYGSINPYERGLTFRPLAKNIIHPKYKEDYRLLLEQLHVLLK